MGPLSALPAGRGYLDANVFVYALEGYPPAADALALLFGAIERGEVLVATSELTLAECLVMPIRTGNQAHQEAYHRALCERAGLHLAPISRGVLVRAAELRAGHPPLRLPDAIHLATAEAEGCS